LLGKLGCNGIAGRPAEQPDQRTGKKTKNQIVRTYRGGVACMNLR
jgi:hypothetical protein